LYLFMGMTGLPPGEFSLISPGTKIPGQVTENPLVTPAKPLPHSVILSPNYEI
jgi:hypothetical protein